MNEFGKQIYSSHVKIKYNILYNIIKKRQDTAQQVSKFYYTFMYIFY